MKYVIDIPEDVFKRTVFYREFRDLNDCVTTIKALEKAVPLPEGHGDLIDADKMIKELNERIQTFDEGRNEIRKQLGKPEENNQIPLWLWKGCCETCGIIIEGDKENKQ